MQANFDLEEMANVIQAVADYKKLAMHFMQLTSPPGNEPLLKFWTKKVVKRTEKTWMQPHEYDDWCRMNIHVVHQMWGNTSGGWNGIGGAAMTESYTTVIENLYYGLVAVYYNGKLAYICEHDDKYLECTKNSKMNLPGLNHCERKLTILYKHKR